MGVGGGVYFWVDSDKVLVVLTFWDYLKNVYLCKLTEYICLINSSKTKFSKNLNTLL